MSNPPPTDPPVGDKPVTPLQRALRQWVVHLLRLRVWLTERSRADLWDSNYFWAVIVGLLGALSSVAFREALDRLQKVLLGYDSSQLASSTDLPWWQRLLIPAAGGLVAGAILLLGEKWSKVGRSHDYM